MNFYDFSGSHKAMGSIHLSAVTKLYYSLWPDVEFRWFKGSLASLPLLCIVSFLLERKESSSSHFHSRK